MNWTRKLLVIICLASIGFPSVMPVSAAPSADSASPSGFNFDYWPLATGPFHGGLVDRSSPTLADLTGDGLPEVLVGTTARSGTGGLNKDTLLAVMTWDGTAGGDNMDIWWTVDVNAPINSTPAVGDVDNDGQPDVVVTVGGDPADLNHHGGVRVYDHNGQIKGFFNSHDWLDRNGYADGVFSSPVLCDVDADGDMEISYGGWDHRIYLLDYVDGSLVSLWNNEKYGSGYFNQDTVWSSPACADLNRDGYREIIIGADISNIAEGGYLYVFDKDGNALVRRFIPETIYSSPAVGDLDGDGDMEIVTGTGWAWWNIHGRTDPSFVYVFETNHVFDDGMAFDDPAKLPHADGWPVQTAYPGYSSPALADLDGDRDLEIIIGSGDPYKTVGDPSAGEGQVHAWHHNGVSLPGWPIEPKDRWLEIDTAITSSPTVADLDGDGDLEILFSMGWSVFVYNIGGDMQERLYPFELAGVFSTSPAVGDADGDGKPEMWIGGGGPNGTADGHLWRFEWGTQDPDGWEAPWPTFHRDARNTGSYAPPFLTVLPDSLCVTHEYGSGSIANTSISVANLGDGEIDWAFTSYPPTVTLGSLSGTVDGAEQTIPVTISVSSYVTGTYELGDIVLTGTVEGEVAAGSPINVPVTLYVGPIHRIYLPAVVRN